MHFTCEKQQLKTGIDQAYKAVGSSANMPILSHICLTVKGGCLELAGTDLNAGIVSKIDVAGIEDGSTAVPADSFKKIIDSFDLGEIEIEHSPLSSLIISAKHSRYELPTLPSDEFPALEIPETRHTFSIKGKDLSYMLNSVKFAAADVGSTRPHMQSVYMDIRDGQIIMVSTDGKRMARVMRPLEEELTNFSVIIPKTGVEKLLGIIAADETYRVDVCEKQVFFSNGSVMFNCSLIDAKYPDYTRFFAEDKDKKRCIVDRAVLLKALKRVLLMAKEKVNLDLVEFEFGKDVLTLASQSAAVGSGLETVSIENEGEPLGISFNGSFIIEALNALACEQLEIDLKTANSGITLRPLDSKSYDYICMPLRR